MTDGTVCVYCRRRPIDRDWRPFCSERCKLLDLRNWVDERYRVPGDTDSTLPDRSRDSDEAGTGDGGQTRDARQGHTRKQR